MDQLTDRREWKDLQTHHRQIAPAHLRDLFADDADRAERFTIEDAGLMLDYSKNRMTAETMRRLTDLAEDRQGACEVIDDRVVAVTVRPRQLVTVELTPAR